MKEFSTSEVVSTGWEYAKSHGILVAVILFVVGLVASGVGSIFGTTIDTSQIQSMTERMSQGDTAAMQQYFETIGNQSTGTWISSLVETIVMTGLFNYALLVMKGQANSLEFSVFKLPLATYLKYFAVEIIVGIIMVVGFCCCIVPGIFLGARLALAGVYVVDNPEVGVFDAISASWRMTNGHTGGMIGLGFIFVGISILGFLCCCIGVYFAEVVILFATVAAYLALKSEAPAGYVESEYQK